VAAMEDVLDLYQRPYNPEIPVICMDEKPYQLLEEKRKSLPVRPGSVKKTDYEYVRNGTCSIFVFTEPLAGLRHVEALEHRRKSDFAHQVKNFVDINYPNHKKVILISDNLNTHNVSSFYETFDPETARLLSRKIEFHHTPKHGSWLNVAEIELSALSTQCLKARIPSLAGLNSELSTWERYRNLNHSAVNWHFTTSDARTKLKSLYPKF
jgi:hypothetical protein